MVQQLLSPPFASIAAELVPLVNRALAEAVALGPGCTPPLGDAIRYSLLGPGKRLRPMLVLLACEACGGERSQALAGACAVEMVHAYSLIHDDLPAMDDDDLRRGRPTCHRAFDEGTAILAGDALLALSFEVLAEGMPAAVAGRACAVLAKAAGPEWLVGGQMSDLQGSFAGATAEDLEFIHARKTGAMFRASLQLGGLAAGASEEKLQILEHFGQTFGLAFQIIDDILDVTGEAELVGKRLGKDQEQGKLTFPGLLGLANSETRAKGLITSAIASLAPLGDQAAGLISLAQFVVDRRH